MLAAVGKLPVRCDHGQRRAAIAQSLLTEIFHGKLRAGQRLVTEQLAKRFGVSHTPIREALIELAGIGIVDLLSEPRRNCPQGHRPRCPRNLPGSPHPRMRRHPQRLWPNRPAAIAEARPGDSGVDGHRAPSQSAFIEQARALDSRLHDLIAASCGNSHLASELGRLKTLFRAFRDVAWEHDQARNDYHRIAEEGHEHLAIVEALLRERRQVGVQSDGVAHPLRHPLLDPGPRLIVYGYRLRLAFAPLCNRWT